MVKYVKEDTSVVFEEIPGELTLAINISNCQNHCKGCHSPYLAKDIGDSLDEKILDALMIRKKGITCVSFMGEGNDKDTLIRLANHVKSNNLKVALYSGRESIPEQEIWDTFDYVKVGPYMEEFGPLNEETTNQRLYKMDGSTKIDITSKFWRKRK